MSEHSERAINQAAYRRLRGFIDANYPAGRFLAISQGEIVADAEGFNEINFAIQKISAHSSEVLVVQAGVDYPDTVTIFALRQSPCPVAETSNEIRTKEFPPGQWST
ncbi:MAG TPA: hypothetical protein VF306_15390 [Pirellulales bacterium]